MSRLLVIAISALVILIHPLIPLREVNLLSADKFEPRLHDDSERGGHSTYQWLDKSKNRFRCVISDKIPYPSCGFTSIGIKNDYSMDLTEFDRVRIRFHHVGEQVQVRIFMHSMLDNYSKDTDLNSQIYSFIKTTTGDSPENTVLIKLDDIKTAEWWLDSRGLTTIGTQTNLSKVKDFGIDIPSQGISGAHDLEIAEFVVEGQWVKAETLYLSIIIFWALYISGESFFRFLKLKRQVILDARRLEELTQHTEMLRTESERYKDLSTTDQLTGLLNRAGLAQRISELFGPAGNASYALLLIDIDLFKLINDRYGHAIGDQVLAAIAQIIQYSTRSNDVISRWGGEEFLLICPVSDATSAQIIAEKIRMAVASHRFMNNLPNKATVSIGVTMLTNEDSMETAFKRCDKALYQAKSTGRNRIEFLV